VFLSDRFGLVVDQGVFLVFLLDRFIVGILEVLFTTIFFSCSFQMAEEGFLRASLPVVGSVELLFLASFSSCSFEMAEGFSRAFLPSGVSPGAITEVLGPDVPKCFFEMSSTDLSAPANTSLWLTGNSGVSAGAIIEVLGLDVPALA
jgi:hypothetical protein